ncbi:ribonuclease Y [soil metagenome]
MSAIVSVLVAVGGALVIGVGFVVGRLAQVGSAQRRLETALSETESIALDAEERAERFEREHVQKVQEELARRRRKLDQRIAEHKARNEKMRARLDERRTRLEAKMRQISEREALLIQAVDAVEALTTDAERRRLEAEKLGASVQDLAKGVGRRQQDIAAREQELEQVQHDLESREARLNTLTEEHLQKLENVSGLSRQEAVKQLNFELVRTAKIEAAASIKDVVDEARLSANRQAREVILTAIQRTSAQQTVENTVSVVPLASDDFKGRIIGREGRNIRAFEAATGIEVIVDDTPEAVILSGFDAVRREVARLALTTLIQDGRIHPARIEEVVEKTRLEIEEEIIETGERAVIDLQLHGLHPELVRLVGRMKYRSSYGQNLLAHSIETAELASLMAAELGLDARKSRRAGLLHDIGKVIEGALESPHAIAGMEICQRYKEHPEICNAVGAHHDEIEMTTTISPIVQAADAMSGARPGARREALENYIERLQALEALAASFEGVERTYAIQAGREIRVIVNHTLVSDALADQLARDISKRIEQELQYPGQIKVTVIRELRAVSFAK